MSMNSFFMKYDPEEQWRNSRRAILICTITGQACNGTGDDDEDCRKCLVPVYFSMIDPERFKNLREKEEDGCS